MSALLQHEGRLEATPAGSLTSSHYAIWKYIATIFVVMWGLYGGTLGYPFFFDDHVNIRDNPDLRDWNGIREILTNHSRPVVMLTFAANYALSQERVGSYHFVNLIIHGAAGLVLFGLIRRTLLLPGLKNYGPSSSATSDWARNPGLHSQEAFSLAVAISLLFIIHPLQTQSVTYIVQRMESLMGLFFLLTFYAVVRAQDSARPAVWYLLAIISCWLGMGCKQVMVACPLILLMFDRIYLAPAWRQVWNRWWLHVSTFLSLGWLAWLSQLGHEKVREVTAGFGVGKITPWEYLSSQGGVILHYLRLTFWPDTLCIDYKWPLAKDSLAIYPPCAILLALLLGSVWLLWKRPRIGLVAISFFLILAPTSSFMPIADLAFEHRMYLPLACVIILVAIAVHQGTARLPLSLPQLAALRVALLVLPALALGSRTWLRNRDYAKEMGMWQLVAQQRPENPRPIKVLAFWHKQSGRREEAVKCYEQALRMDPGCYLTWIDYGSLFLRERDFDGALRCYRRATEERPDVYDPWVNIANIQARQGEMHAALESCAKARSLMHKPYSYKECKIRAWVLSTSEDATLRNGKAAIELLSALKSPRGRTDVDLLDRLAAAYAETGNFSQAIEIQKQVISAGISQKIGQDLLKECTARLELYQQGIPYRVIPSALGTLQSGTPTPLPDTSPLDRSADAKTSVDPS